MLCAQDVLLWQKEFFRHFLNEDTSVKIIEMILNGETFILEQYGNGSKSVSNIDGAKGFYVQFAIKSYNATQLLHANLIIPNIAYTYNSLIMRESTLKITKIPNYYFIAVWWRSILIFLDTYILIKISQVSIDTWDIFY